MTDTFTWLHFSDLHSGSNNAENYWPNINEKLFPDIKTLLKENKLSINAILFTGDLVNKGTEYANFNEFLNRFKNEFPDEKPIFLSVPGNHDLVRPDNESSHETHIIKKHWATDEKIRNCIWKKQTETGTWKLIQNVFKNYTSWLENENRPFSLPNEYFYRGLLPGDFAYTFRLKNGSKIGVLGLNSAFLQLDDGKDRNGYKGCLDLHISQLTHLFEKYNGSHADWFQEHSLCLVMTHHPVDWLSKEGKKQFLEEINNNGRCPLHLCGHTHESAFKSWSNTVSDGSWKMWMGTSLFSMEKDMIQKKLGEENYTDRRHGYSLGSITINEQKGTARIWPRKTNINNNFVIDTDLAEKKNYCDIDIKINTSSTTKIKQPNQKINQKINQEMKQLIIDHYSSEAVFDDLCQKLNTKNIFQGDVNDRVTALCKRIEKRFTNSVDRLRQVFLLIDKILCDKCNVILKGDKLIDIPQQKPHWAHDFGKDDYGFWTEIIIEGNTQRLRWIKPGVFIMGSPEAEHGRYSSERQHEVILKDAFWMTENVCTQELWEKIMGTNPSRNIGSKLPADNLTWYQCKEFLKKINQIKSGFQFYLPTEAQWEYCCRAGTQTPFSFGNDIDEKQVNYEWEYPYNREPEIGSSKQSSESKLMAVKSLPANQWGLYEMHGNVYEWCHDYHAEYEPGILSNPKGPSGGSKRIIRGGCWMGEAKILRSACRYKEKPDDSHVSGFRFCCDA